MPRTKLVTPCLRISAALVFLIASGNVSLQAFKGSYATYKDTQAERNEGQTGLLKCILNGNANKVKKYLTKRYEASVIRPNKECIQAALATQDREKIEAIAKAGANFTEVNIPNKNDHLLKALRGDRFTDKQSGSQWHYYHRIKLHERPVVAANLAQRGDITTIYAIVEELKKFPQGTQQALQLLWYARHHINSSETGELIFNKQEALSPGAGMSWPEEPHQK